MAIRVVILASAEQDIKDLKSYVQTNFGKPTWLSTKGEIRDAIKTIASHPMVGNIPPEFEALNLTQYRQILTGLNRIIYETPAGSTVAYVHVICDQRRDLKTLLTRRLLRGV
ncbi:plasmid stabilization protein [Burkholderia cepacia]|uniref:type II toxin-antitoxin system RelE/ParE family toxin n=1 Tax=Burkholderia cepacia TaxID=292 RepID=UPI000752A94C|nr:type II toxin-antitoxin system RelE/ParE family toxin [Burkholderia cepacia]KVV20867.1 plasmid stabilization protein [Burkholderia cepacia]